MCDSNYIINTAVNFVFIVNSLHIIYILVIYR
jgi:hypothetical protein